MPDREGAPTFVPTVVGRVRRERVSHLVEGYDRNRGRRLRLRPDVPVLDHALRMAPGIIVIGVAAVCEMGPAQGVTNARSASFAPPIQGWP